MVGPSRPAACRRASSEGQWFLGRRRRRRARRSGASAGQEPGRGSPSSTTTPPTWSRSTSTTWSSSALDRASRRERPCGADGRLGDRRPPPGRNALRRRRARRLARVSTRSPSRASDVVSLPLAIARAVFDGADVVVCATYVEGTTSPMLDDALDVASHLGRGGRGSVVVFPTGRETASPGARSTPASRSSSATRRAIRASSAWRPEAGRADGFCGESPRGLVRPFANRGPAVRWLAPGDDLAYPFSSRDRLFHAESSGASAVAAGVMLLVLGSNPELKVHEVHAILERSVDEPEDPPSDGRTPRRPGRHPAARLRSRRAQRQVRLRAAQRDARLRRARRIRWRSVLRPSARTSSRWPGV